VKVTIKAERLEGFWREVTRQWNRQVLNTVPGAQDLLLSEREWLVLWRGVLATRCLFVDPQGEYPRYRAQSLRLHQNERKEDLTCPIFGHSTENQSVGSSAVV
jgi:hypothetical protein